MEHTNNWSDAVNIEIGKINNTLRDLNKQVNDMLSSRKDDKMTIEIVNDKIEKCAADIKAINDMYNNIANTCNVHDLQLKVFEKDLNKLSEKISTIEKSVMSIDKSFECFKTVSESSFENIKSSLCNIEKASNKNTLLITEEVNKSGKLGIKAWMFVAAIVGTAIVTGLIELVVQQFAK